MHPELDPAPILKLALFAHKIETNQRKLRRLVIEADWTGHTRAEIATAAGVGEKQVGVIINAGVGDLSWPRSYRAPDKRTVLEELRRLAVRTKRCHERVEWWIVRASDQGWSASDIAQTTGLDIDQIEAIASTREQAV